VSDSKSETRSGIPGLYRIPVIGPALFGSYNRPADDNRRRNLLIFLTPTVIQEKAGDLLKYKGRVLEADEEAITTPTATISDYETGPALLPPDKTSYGGLLPDKTSYGSAAPISLGFPSDSGAVPPVELPPVETAPPVDIAPPAEDIRSLDTNVRSQATIEEAPGELAELKKIRIDDSKLRGTTDSLTSLLPHMPGPSGPLSGTGAGTTGGPAGTAATAGAPAGTTAAAGRTAGAAVATPGIFQQPVSGNAATSIVSSPAATPVVAPPPQPETRIR
jgi:hypothetical protein